MTIIANPIYDAVFKFLMEDKKVAKILLSALLKKEIIDLEMRRHEYTSMEQTRISLFRIDFSAKIREHDGSEHLVLIELQKTWLITETLRFRQYLGTQYLNKENIIEEKNEHGQKRTYGLPSFPSTSWGIPWATSPSRWSMCAAAIWTMMTIRSLLPTLSSRV